MKKYSEDKFIEKLRKKEMKYSRSGGNIMVCCPFHGENNPSLGIHFEKEAWRCMGCGKKGKGRKSMEYLFYGLFGKFKHEDYQEENEEARIIDLVKLKEKLNISLKEKKEKIKVLINFTLDNFKYPKEEYLKYLEKRKINNKVLISDFEIKSGFWRGNKRIIIPVKDEYGRLISVYGRSIQSDEKDIRIRKSKESDISKTLFGLRQILQNDYYGFSKVGVVVEGEIDAIYLHKFKIPAFCIGSKDVSEIQLIKMLKYFEVIYISLDGDVDNKQIRKLKNVVSEYIGKVSIIKMPSSELDPNKLTEKEVSEVYNMFL